jgi:hypothetical protein
VSTPRLVVVLCVAATAVSSADPLGGVETRVDQIEKQLDHDATR